MNTQELIKGCKQMSAAFATFAKALQEEEKLPSNKEPTSTQYTLEAVRAKLAELAHEGHREEVKAIVGKRGQSLSDIDPAEFSAIMSEAEAISHV